MECQTLFSGKKKIKMLLAEIFTQNAKHYAKQFLAIQERAFRSYANSKGTDQPAHLCSQITAVSEH